MAGGGDVARGAEDRVRGLVRERAVVAVDGDVAGGGPEVAELAMELAGMMMPSVSRSSSVTV